MSIRIVTIGIICVFLCFSLAVCGQTNSATVQLRHERISELDKQLRWQDEAAKQRYLATKDAVTKRVFDEVDGFISESVQPNAVTPDRLKTTLDALLGVTSAQSNNVALTVKLPTGHFLIVGIDVSRGGNAISEDAISLRAYKDNGQNFALIAADDSLRSSDSSNPFLSDLHVQPLPSPPVVGEFWFIASARVPPQSPATVVIRLFAFDGQQFRTMWAPPDILAASTDKAVEITASGFAVHRLFDPTGRAAHSPNVVIHEQYALSVNGAVKVNESQSHVQ